MKNGQVAVNSLLFTSGDSRVFWNRKLSNVVQTWAGRNRPPRKKSADLGSSRCEVDIKRVYDAVIRPGNLSNAGLILPTCRLFRLSLLPQLIHIKSLQPLRSSAKKLGRADIERMKWVTDTTGRFPRRPHYLPDELDAECEHIISSFLKDRHGRI